MTSYLLIAVISIFSLAMFSRGTVFLQANERSQNKIIAFNMAEAGIDLAITQLQADVTYAGVGYTDMGTGTVEGGYQVAVTTPNTAPNVRLIQSTGHAPLNDMTQKAYETRTIQAYVSIGTQSYFDFAVFSKDGMQLNGNPLIDSYDSRNGAYGGANRNQNGDIGTDSTGAGTVSLNGNVEVRGDAEVGPGGNPNSVVSVSGNSSITGTLSAAPAERAYEPAATNLPSLGNLRVNGNQTQTLPAGTYHYDSISISGNGELEALGAVEIYVSGSVTISGNGVSTQANLPPNFIIYVTTGDTVKVSGNGNFYGAIYAPASHVMNTGNGEIYGAVVSRTYHQAGNGNVHYDEALKDTGGSGEPTVSLLSWQENNTVAGG